MKYMGSKRRIAKFIRQWTAPYRGKRPWVEPFVGGGNMIEVIHGERWANDANRYVIACLQAVADGWKPPEEVTVDEYKRIWRAKDEYPAALVGFVGICCAFGAKWGGSYARSGSSGTNYAAVGSRGLLRQAARLQGIKWQHGDYAQMTIPAKALIYCDPPYQQTERYRGVGRWDAARFWQWCRDRQAEGHHVFVSEYDAPLGWRCVMSVELRCNIDNQKGKAMAVKKERLWTLCEKI